MRGTPRHLRHEPNNGASLTLTWSHSSLAGKGPAAEKAHKGKERAQAEAQREQAPRGRLNVGYSLA